MSGGWPEPPAGFTRRDDERRALYADSAALTAVLGAGLDREETWERALSAPVAGGRRGTAILGDWRLKALGRGGVLGAMWRDRYPGVSRPVSILRATVEAAARGVPTAAAVALLVTLGPGRMARGFFAVRELDGFEDMGSRARRGTLDEHALAAALAAVRAMHDHGVIHPDLNLGNVLVRETAVAIIDFDRARFLDGGAPFAERQAAIRRLERSCAKITGCAGALGPGSEPLWYELYAGDDASLRARLERGRAVGRLALAAHRARWRITGT
ncbi:MAG TPA: lipopolysaccharide kinase InaA family protein [Candidatus Polarisedimenticolaceae bacterium]|nr:lipopolysaccharide kinase InaA family protein [Candidatus Polarisedimenticolaceae bacterium]